MDWSLHTRKACMTPADLRTELEAVDVLHEKSRIKALLLKDLEPEARMAGLTDQVALVISAAVALAEGLAKTGRGPFHASIGGSFDAGDGALERTIVNVDISPPELET